MDAMDMQIQNDYITQTMTNDVAENYDRSPSSKDNSVHPLTKCKSCNQGYIKDRYTKCGYILACIFFPCGLICCIALRESECSRCGVKVSNKG